MGHHLWSNQNTPVSLDVVYHQSYRYLPPVLIWPYLATIYWRIKTRRWVILYKLRLFICLQISELVWPGHTANGEFGVESAFSMPPKDKQRILRFGGFHINPCNSAPNNGNKKAERRVPVRQKYKKMVPRQGSNLGRRSDRTLLFK